MKNNFAKFSSFYAVLFFSLFLIASSAHAKDTDGDGISDSEDNCVDTPNMFQQACGIISLPQNKYYKSHYGIKCDFDCDGVLNSEDNCPSDFNNHISDDVDQLDTDEDGQGDACDDTPLGVDSDEDGVKDYLDNCPSIYNPDQKDSNDNGIGDACNYQIALPIPTPNDGDGTTEPPAQDPDKNPGSVNPGDSPVDSSETGGCQLNLGSTSLPNKSLALLLLPLAFAATRRRLLKNANAAR